MGVKLLRLSRALPAEGPGPFPRGRRGVGGRGAAVGSRRGGMAVEGGGCLRERGCLRGRDRWGSPGLWESDPRDGGR